MKELDDLIKRIQLANGYVQRLDGQFADQSRVIYGGPVLWETDEEAQFELDNQQAVDAVRVVTQDIHRILKG